MDPELAAGGRLIMLGTPNYGSFAIVQAMTGQDRMIELAREDRRQARHGRTPGGHQFLSRQLQLLPAPSKLRRRCRPCTWRATWCENAARLQGRHLDRAHQFFADLENGVTIDSARMAYVAGCRQATSR